MSRGSDGSYDSDVRRNIKGGGLLKLVAAGSAIIPAEWRLIEAGLISSLAIYNPCAIGPL